MKKLFNPLLSDDCDAFQQQKSTRTSVSSQDWTATRAAPDRIVCFFFLGVSSLGPLRALFKVVFVWLKLAPLSCLSPLSGSFVRIIYCTNKTHRVKNCRTLCSREMNRGIFHNVSSAVRTYELCNAIIFSAIFVVIIEDVWGFLGNLINIFL